METRIFNISDDLEDVLSKSADILKKGGLVAFPTETVYGLGANPFNLKAVYKIYHVKGRPKDNPLIFHISSIDWLGRLAFFSEREKGLIEKFFPGPLTLVFKSRIKSIYTFGLNTIAVRMPDNFIALKLIDRFGLPIVAPSANLSGKPSPTKVEHVIEDFNGKIEAIIDGGETVYGIESTVIDVTEYPYKVLRFGSVKLEDIKDAGFEVNVAEEKELFKRSPGTRYRHYAPLAELIIISEEKDFYFFKNILDEKKCGYMGIEEFSNLRFHHREIFRDEREYSKYLYATLRYFDAIKVEVIFAQSVTEKGWGLAINDRLRKASARAT